MSIVQYSSRMVLGALLLAASAQATSASNVCLVDCKPNPQIAIETQSPVALVEPKKEDPSVSDLVWKFTGKFKPEGFYGKNINFLNNIEDLDRQFYIRHTLDFNLHVDYGFKTYCEKVAEFHMNMRNKAIWGNPRSISMTTSSDVKADESVIGSHQHHIPRNFFWMREVWVNINVNRSLSLTPTHTHWFKIGAFPFELGRGIVLGSAYAVGQDFIGFYSDTAIDQYAYGFNLTGELMTNLLSYDLYAAILRNHSNGLSDTAAKVMGQEYGHRSCPERGFGKINYVIAGRTFWTPLNCESSGSLSVEPYWLYNRDPEQRVEFDFDAISQLATFGLAAEYQFGRFECGFDTAVNTGNQKVRGWDRNAILLKNRNGKAYFVNSHVIAGVDPSNTGGADLNLYKVPYATALVGQDGSIPNSKQIQGIVWGSEQSEQLNGQQIGTSTVLAQQPVLEAVELPYNGTSPIVPGTPVPLYNAKDRYRDPYENVYHGWMIVGDAAYWIQKDRFRIAFMGGIASGDDDPNFETIDGIYDGFIGLQETYCGDRVKSVFVLGGSGKLKRPLSLTIDPTIEVNDFDATIAGFTDIALLGGSLFWQNKQACKPWDVHTNAIVYWVDQPKLAFDALNNKTLDTYASRYLGTELNILSRVQLFKNTRFFAVGSLFIPGTYYQDIKGKPFNKDQQRFLKEYLDREDVTGYEDDPLPNVGTDTAFTFNMGVEFNF